MSSRYAAWLVALCLSEAGCTSDRNLGKLAQADILPYGEETIADTTARVSEVPCALARRVRLLSYGDGLRIETYQVVEPGCPEPSNYPDYAQFPVASVDSYAGRKSYLANSPFGALWIHDDRQLKPEAKWRVVTYDYEANIAPGETAWQTFAATDVTDYNFLASGTQTYSVRIRLHQPLSLSEVLETTYSLLVDPAQSHVIADSDDMAYDLLVTSDFPVAHVLSQLRANSIVKSAHLMK